MPAHKGYRQLWITAGYGLKMSSASVTKPPPPHLIRAYHFTSADHALNDLAHSRLKVARFSDANDPFELLALNFREHHVRKVMREFKSSNNSQTGFLSFSRNWNNPVLWSHYASRHHGVCLGFDLLRARVQEVEYEDQRILAQLDEFNDPTKIDADLKQRLLCTKSSHWDYEEELRVFVELKDAEAIGSLHFHAFNGDMKLAEVVLGPECDLSLDAVRALTAIRHPDAIVINARLAFGSFGVVPLVETIP